MKTRCLLISVVLLIVGCSTSTFVPILGSSRGWKNASDRRVVEDITVSGLRIRVSEELRDGACATGAHHSVEIDGPINKDTSFALEKLLTELPRCVGKDGRTFVPTVYMSSRGGTLKDGFAVGDVFRRVGVAARVTEGQACASACAVAFLGGTYRGLSFDGKLVFHAPYRRDVYGVPRCVDRSSGEGQLLRSYYVNMLGESGHRLFDRTMDYCSDVDGWTVDAGAARLFGLLR